MTQCGLYEAMTRGVNEIFFRRKMTGVLRFLPSGHLGCFCYGPGGIEAGEVGAKLG